MKSEAGGWRRVVPPGFLVGQAIKHVRAGRVKEVVQRVGHGSLPAIQVRLEACRAGRRIQIAYIERFNATCRSWLAPLVRRSRCLARTQALLEHGIYLLGGAYNFCWVHRSLRERQYATGWGDPPRKWEPRTPAMAAGLTDHVWSFRELLWYHVPPRPWRPSRRHRPQRWKLRPNKPVLLPSTV